MNPLMLELITAFGWTDIHTPNPSSMISFKNEFNNRMNIYVRKMTVTIQKDKCFVFKNVDTIEKLEDLLELNK